MCDNFKAKWLMVLNKKSSVVCLTKLSEKSLIGEGRSCIFSNLFKWIKCFRFCTDFIRVYFFFLSQIFSILWWQKWNVFKNFHNFSKCLNKQKSNVDVKDLCKLNFEIFGLKKKCTLLLLILISDWIIIMNFFADGIIWLSKCDC
jgi:hypothetical protein